MIPLAQRTGALLALVALAAAALVLPATDVASAMGGPCAFVPEQGGVPRCADRLDEGAALTLRPGDPGVGDARDGATCDPATPGADALRGCAAGLAAAVGPAAAPSPDATAPPVVPLRVATAAALLPVALGAALYSRFHGRPGVLRSGTRERLVGVVRLHPGVSVTDAAGLMGLARNAVQHHVRLLERVGIVRVEDARGRKALYLRDAPPSDAPPAWLLKNAACAAVVRALHERPEGLPREAVHGLMKDLPERTRNYNIQKLLAVGVMEQVETPGGRKVLRATRPACGG